MIRIPFYETSHFVFSNFSPHVVNIEGVAFPTVEHAYHAAKFNEENIKREIQQPKSPLIAYEDSIKSDD